MCTYEVVKIISTNSITANMLCFMSQIFFTEFFVNILELTKCFREIKLMNTISLASLKIQAIIPQEQ